MSLMYTCPHCMKPQLVTANVVCPLDSGYVAVSCPGCAGDAAYLAEPGFRAGLSLWAERVLLSDVESSCRRILQEAHR